jgi:hypothetical protein
MLKKKQTTDVTLTINEETALSLLYFIADNLSRVEVTEESFDGIYQFYKLLRSNVKEEDFYF